MPYLLYQKPWQPQVTAPDMEIHEFIPHPGKLYQDGETKKWKTTLVRLYFWLITMGKAKIVYVADQKTIMHTSYVIPKCVKFAFMQTGDYEIGPCFTHPDYRGRGIYPKVLQYITANEIARDRHFYMIVHPNNKSSIRGIEKGGFTQCGAVQKTRILKHYK